MRWSIEELIKDLRVASNRDRNFWYRLTHLHQSVYRQVKAFFHWMFTGNAYSPTWNTHRALIEDLIYRLTQFKNLKKQGYPVIDNVEDIEDWNNLLDSIIIGLEGALLVIDNEDAPDNPFKDDFFKLVLDKFSNEQSKLSKEEIDRLKEEYKEYESTNNRYHQQLMDNFVKAMEKLTKNILELWD